MLFEIHWAIAMKEEESKERQVHGIRGEMIGMV